MRTVSYLGYMKPVVMMVFRTILRLVRPLCCGMVSEQVPCGFPPIFPCNMLLPLCLRNLVRRMLLKCIPIIP